MTLATGELGLTRLSQSEARDEPGSDQSQAASPGHYYRLEKLNEVSIILTGPGHHNAHTVNKRKMVQRLSNNILLLSYIDHKQQAWDRNSVLFSQALMFSRDAASKVASS